MRKFFYLFKPLEKMRRGGVAAEPHFGKCAALGENAAQAGRGSCEWPFAARGKAFPRRILLSLYAKGIVLNRESALSEERV